MAKFARTMSSEITQNSSQESSRPMWLWQAGALNPVAACEDLNGSCIGGVYSEALENPAACPVK